jgi:hypothetical protein
VTALKNDFFVHSCSHHSRLSPRPALETSVVVAVDLGAVDLGAVDLEAVLEVLVSEELTHTQLPLVEVEEPHPVATGPPHHNTGYLHKHLSYTNTYTCTFHLQNPRTTHHESLCHPLRHHRNIIK